jgi:transcriptional regulator with XRE-family HTH domain
MVPSQIKALRLRASWTQSELGVAASMKQARISDAEKPGKVAFSLETLIRIASAFKVGLQVRFVPFSTMLEWENSYSQDKFSVAGIDNDADFLNPLFSNEQEAKSMTVRNGDGHGELETYGKGHMFENTAISGGSRWIHQ